MPNTLTSAAAEVEVQAFWADYIAALKDGDAQRVTAFYRDSVYLLEPGLPTLRTQAEVLSAAREVLASARILDSRILPELTEVFGSSVAQYGSYVDSLEAPGQKPFHRYGRFSAMLSRDAGGRWRLSRLTALVDSTPGAAPPSGGP